MRKRFFYDEYTFLNKTVYCVQIFVRITGFLTSTTSPSVLSLYSLRRITFRSARHNKSKAVSFPLCFLLWYYLHKGIFPAYWGVGITAYILFVSAVVVNLRLSIIRTFSVKYPYSGVLQQALSWFSRPCFEAASLTWFSRRFTQRHWIDRGRPGINLFPSYMFWVL